MVKSKLLLNVLLTKHCNAKCPFCVERTKEFIPDKLNWQDFAERINAAIEADIVSTVSLLGGEPLYWQGLLDLVEAIKIPPYVTTNGYRLAHDAKFRDDLSNAKLSALNISIPHYTSAKSSALMNIDETELWKTLPKICAKARFPIRINTLLLRGYIETIGDVLKMAEWVSSIGAQELKVAELTAVNGRTHDFVVQDVVLWNQRHYVPIPDDEIRKKAHEEGGTHYWQTVKGVKVFFNASPDRALSGGKDKYGNYYHRVLFNDGLMGFSWRREDTYGMA